MSPTCCCTYKTEHRPAPADVSLSTRAYRYRRRSASQGRDPGTRRFETLTKTTGHQLTCLMLGHRCTPRPSRCPRTRAAAARTGGRIAAAAAAAQPPMPAGAKRLRQVWNSSKSASQHMHGHRNVRSSRAGRHMLRYNALSNDAVLPCWSEGLAERSELNFMPNLCRSTPRCSEMNRWLAPLHAVRPPMPHRSQFLAICVHGTCLWLGFRVSRRSSGQHVHSCPYIGQCRRHKQAVANCDNPHAAATPPLARPIANLKRYSC